MFEKGPGFKPWHQGIVHLQQKMQICILNIVSLEDKKEKNRGGMFSKEWKVQ